MCIKFLDQIFLYTVWMDSPLKSKRLPKLPARFGSFRFHTGVHEDSNCWRHWCINSTFSKSQRCFNERQSKSYDFKIVQNTECWWPISIIFVPIKLFSHGLSNNAHVIEIGLVHQKWEPQKFRAFFATLQYVCMIAYIPVLVHLLCMYWRALQCHSMTSSMKVKCTQYLGSSELYMAKRIYNLY